MFNLKDNIKESFVDNKSIILFSTLLFIITLILGYFFTAYLYSTFNPVVNQLSEEVKNGTISFTFQTIFLNNILIVFRLFLFGMLAGISTILLAFNGFFLGYFIGVYGNLTKALLLTVPHGIFEIPSIIIANASGLTLFKFVFNVVTLKNIPDKSKNENYFAKLYVSANCNYKYLKQSLILLGISIILMIIAGIIEVYITKNLALFLMNLLGI